jgi:hypothetical protein
MLIGLKIAIKPFFLIVNFHNRFVKVLTEIFQFRMALTHTHTHCFTKWKQFGAYKMRSGQEKKKTSLVLRKKLQK